MLSGTCLLRGSALAQSDLPFDACLVSLTLSGNTGNIPVYSEPRIFGETLRYSFGVALVGVEKPDRANDPRYDSARRGAARDNFDAGGTT